MTGLGRWVGLIAAATLVPAACGADRLRPTTRPAPLPPWKTIRVQAVVLSDDDGRHRAEASPGEIERWVDYANTVYGPARVQFAFDHETDFSTMRSTPLNQMMSAEGVREPARALAMDFPGKLLLLVRHGPLESPTGQGFSGGDLDFVALPGFRCTSIYGRQNITLMAHETGHYLGLSHTFAGEFNTAVEAESFLWSHGSRPEVFDGDGLADTPPEPMIKQVGEGDEMFVVLAGVRFDLARTNIMSYYHKRRVDQDNKVLSLQQALRVRRMIEVRARGGGYLPVNTPRGIVTECESMKVMQRDAEHLDPQDLSSLGEGRWSGNRQLLWGGHDGAKITLALPVEKAGRYRISLYATSSFDFGIAAFSFDGKALDEPFDAWSPAVAPTGRLTLGIVDLSAGDHSFSATITGKHGESSGHMLGLDCIELEPVGPGGRSGKHAR